MEDNIIISNLNDFIFCPRSIYFHNIYDQYDEHMYHSSYQVKGRNAHENIDQKKYSTKKAILQGIDIYSDEFGIIGKIDLFDIAEKKLIERKNKIKKIYDGYYLQIYAQYFCLIEMSYSIEKIQFHSILDNKVYDIPLPNEIEKNKLKKIISEIQKFSLEDTSFTQNPKKCSMCIYRELCDYYKNDE